MNDCILTAENKQGKMVSAKRNNPASATDNVTSTVQTHLAVDEEHNSPNDRDVDMGDGQKADAVLTAKANASDGYRVQEDEEEEEDNATMEVDLVKMP
jgi:hypothetical protein